MDVNQQQIIPMVMRTGAVMKSAAPEAAPTAEFTPQIVTINAHVNALFGLK